MWLIINLAKTLKNMVEQTNKVTAEQKRLNRLEKFPFYDLNLNSKRPEICIEKVDGMPEEFHYHCQTALQEALIVQKEELYEIADAVVKRLIRDTEE